MPFSATLVTKLTRGAIVNLVNNVPWTFENDF